MDYGKKIRIGNYFALKYKKENFTVIKVGDISGIFSFEVREDSKIFAMYNSLSMDSTEIEKRAIHSIIENVFAATTLIDVEFQHDLRVAVANYLKRVKHDDIDDAQDVKYIEEEKLINEISDLEE